MLLFSHQGSGSTKLPHNATSSSAAARFFNDDIGAAVELYDNQTALYISADVTAGAGTAFRWVRVATPTPHQRVETETTGGTFTDHVLPDGTTAWIFTASATLTPP